jgi:choice-of-anchor A domain-containing protein
MTRSGAVVMAVYVFVWSFAASRTGTAHAQLFAEYPVPTANGGPWGITAGPDGKLWFTELNGNKIGVITTSGHFTEYQIPTGGSAPRGIVTGPDGNLWFAELEANKIGTVTPNGVFTEYTVPTQGSKPYLMVTGPDGNLWFTEDAGNKIAKVTTGGSFTEYAVPTSNSGPTGIAVGSDGNIWFTEVYADKIGKITPTGVITEYPVPTLSALPYLMTAGPDGNVWFSESRGNVAKITPGGQFAEFPVPTSSSHPIGITTGPDGNVWFLEEFGNKVGVITVAGDLTEYPIPTGSSRPTSITAGPDGNLWFTEQSGNIIGRFHPTSAPPPNDECTSATALSSPPFSTSADLTSATDNGADPVRSCSGEVGHHNVWFTFTAASSGMLSVVSTAQLTLYTGACGALVEAACGASGSLSAVITAGQTYVLEVSGPQAVHSVTATVCGDGIVSSPSETCDDGNIVNGDGCDDHCHVPPPNDECTSATALSSPPFSTSADLTGATDNGADPVRSCSGEIGHNNVWYTFTAASTGILSVFSTAQLTLYTGACGALVEAACGASGSLSAPITAGQTYVLEVSGPEAAYSLNATVCGDGVVSAPFETCDDGNLVNGDSCDNNCLVGCPEDLCRCLPNAGKFSVVAGKVTGSLGKSVDFGTVGADIRESICATTGKFSGRLDTEFYLEGDAILTGGVGTTAVSFKGYKLDGIPNPGVYIGGNVVTGGGLVKNPQYASIGAATDMSGTNQKVATCQQAMSELATASAMLASLPPTQTLGAVVVAPDDTATITVGPGRQVVNIDSIKLKSRSAFGEVLWSELDFVLDPATTVLVVNIAKGLSMGALGFVSVDPWDAPPRPGGVIFNFLPGASMSLGAGADLQVSVLAPTTKIRALAYGEDTGFGDLYTTKAVKLKGAYVPGYLACP